MKDFLAGFEEAGDRERDHLLQVAGRKLRKERNSREKLAWIDLGGPRHALDFTTRKVARPVKPFTRDIEGE